ncbi:hypothetical protein Tco_1502120 [Tanacetum coccineum]
MEIPCTNKIKFITACSFSNDTFEDIMKAQESVFKASATLNIQAFKIKKSVSISFRMTQVHKTAKDHMMMIRDYDWMMILKKLKDHIQVKIMPKSTKGDGEKNYELASSRFPASNNQLRTSSNLRNQDTIQDGRVIVQQVQGRQGQSNSGTGTMARQCTQPKRPRNTACYKDKAMLAEAQEAGNFLDEEQLAFLTDPGVPDGQAVQIIIPNNAAF